ncbi:MAG: hypothetical protein HY880_01095 [Deltaproteobacteria bacterium]|nr:hypothetical protein [Deltaproteobacteria bacterium]
MKGFKIVLFGIAAGLVIAAMAMTPKMVFADKKPFTYGTGNLMVVVERENKSVLVIDATDLEVVTRISLPKIHQPHAPVFSPDGRYYYVMGRNGYYAKVDLLAQTIVAEQTIGKDSRGSAISMNGKYIIAGNYAPGSAIIMDANDLKILKTLEGPEAIIKGEIKASRCASITDIGGVKDLMAIAWKDGGEVWIVDMKTAPEFTVVKKFLGAGAILHDGFVSEGGRYFMLASQQSNQMWILDSYKDIVNDPTAYQGTIGTGAVPHPGPGACWGDVCFETNIGTGTVTAYKPATMTFLKNIVTSGLDSAGGLFIRKHPSAPHVIADSVIGQQKTHPFVYVIDVEKLEVIKKIEVGKSAVHPEFSARGAYMFVSAWGEDKVVVYNGLTYEKVKEIPAKTPTSIVNSNRGSELGL